MSKRVVFRCPIADFECPYCDADGYCKMENAVEECDDAANCADDDCYPIEIEDDAVPWPRFPCGMVRRITSKQQKKFIKKYWQVNKNIV
jgi:hypothetical protein